MTINSAYSNDNDENLREFIYRTYFRFESEQEQFLDQLLLKRFLFFFDFKYTFVVSLSNLF